MSETGPSSSSEGSQDEYEVYLQAVWGDEDDSHKIVSSSEEVIEYSDEDSPSDFWNNFGRSVRFASKYQLLLNEDTVLVILNGANDRDEIVSYLQKTRLKYKYLVAPENCFILTILSKIHEISTNTVGHYILSESGLGTHVSPGGSYEINVRLLLMSDVYSNVFRNPSETQGTMEMRRRGEVGVKLPDYSAFPKYLPLIRFIQGAPNIPPFIIETGMSYRAVKVEGNCISFILGVRFDVECVLGIDIRMNQSAQELESIGFIVFDVSVDAMYDLFNSLSDDYKKALVSIVLKRKAEFKLDEVEAIRQLKECFEVNGDYESLCESIKKQYRERMKHDSMRNWDPLPQIPDRNHVKDVLEEFGFQTAELIAEGRYYQDLINRCDEASDYFGAQEVSPDTVYEAEAFVMQQFYRRRKVQTVTAEVQQDLTLPITAFSSTKWCKKDKIAIPANILERCFQEISLHCTKKDLEQCMVRLRTPWEHLREDARKSVALLNRPHDVPEEAALEHLQQLYDEDPDWPPFLTTKLKHWTTKGIKDQLLEWCVPEGGTRYTRLMKFLDKYSDSDDAPPMPVTEYPVTAHMFPNLRKRIRLSSSGSAQMDLPPNVSSFLTTLEKSKSEKLRELLQNRVDEVLLMINDDELALEGLKNLFQEDLSAVKYVLSRDSKPELIVLFLQDRAAALRAKAHHSRVRENAK